MFQEYYQVLHWFVAASTLYVVWNERLSTNDQVLKARSDYHKDTPQILPDLVLPEASRKYF